MIKYLFKPLENSGLELKLAKGTEGASGYDLMANIGTERVIGPGGRLYVQTGLHLSMPNGVEAQIRSRSGMTRDFGVIVLTAPATIDSDYRGEIGATLYNAGQADYVVRPGARIAQLVFAPTMKFFEHWRHPADWEPREVYSIDELGETVRGHRGHGSTGQ